MDRNEFVAKIKELSMEEVGEPSTYLSLTVKNRKGIKIGDAYVFVDLDSSNASVLRIFAPQRVSVKRVDEEGNVITKNHLPS